MGALKSLRIEGDLEGDMVETLTFIPEEVKVGNDSVGSAVGENEIDGGGSRLTGLQRLCDPSLAESRAVTCCGVAIRSDVYEVTPIDDCKHHWGQAISDVAVHA